VETDWDAMGKLTVKVAQAELKPGRYFDGDGLILVVSERDGRLRKSWTFRFDSPVTGKRRETGLGGLDALTLAQARVKARELRDQVAAGKDPLEKTDPVEGDASLTFGAVVNRYIEKEAGAWRSKKTEQAWRNSLARHAQDLMNMKPGDITRHHVAAVLSKIWLSKPELSAKVRQRIEVVCDFAVSIEAAPDASINPAIFNERLRAMLPTKAPRAKRVQHHPALPWKKLPEFMGELHQRPALSARMLELQILTCVRGGEARFALWSEINHDITAWTIPRDRMKSGFEHRVPLSPQARKVLESIPVTDNPLIFPIGAAVDSKAHSENATAALLKRMNHGDITGHGFRSTFRDWVLDNGLDGELAEIALAHRPGEVEGAYRRGDAFDRRIELMNQWGTFCDGK
jgi:integrase